MGYILSRVLIGWMFILGLCGVIYLAIKSETVALAVSGLIVVLMFSIVAYMLGDLFLG
jgi:hypothetical protein